MCPISSKAAMRCVLALALGLWLAGCAIKPGPGYSSVEASLPPVPPGEARIFVYRWLEPYETLTPTRTYFNHQEVGIAWPGAVFYRDVPPGTYLISVFTYFSYPYQFKTFVLAAGQTLHVRIDALHTFGCGEQGWPSCGEDALVVTPVDSETAKEEMRDLRFNPG